MKNNILTSLIFTLSICFGACSSTPKEYVTGSRGGCYYVEADGKKAYVDKSKCQEQDARRKAEAEAVAKQAALNKLEEESPFRTPPEVAPMATPLPTSTPHTHTDSEIAEPYLGTLKKFLQAHPKLAFIKESEFDKDSLEWLRNNVSAGKAFCPFHLINDFNRDGKKDFAVLLKGVNNPKFQYQQISLVVFNGIGEGQFRVAYFDVVDEEAHTPLAYFINVPNWGKGLYYSLFETDAGQALTPKGQGYKTEYLDAVRDRERK